MTAEPDEVVVAIDGGNSKTDVLLVDAAGTVLGSSRGPGVSPQSVGVDTCVRALEGLVVEALEAGGRAAVKPFGAHTSAYLAGLDLPEEEEILSAALGARGWTRSLTVGNDTFALLRAGSSDGTGVAVVCGAGINAVGVGKDGRVHRFPALGKISGDWGGGLGLGEEALWWAARAEDGRGPHTALQEAVAARFDAASVVEVVQRLHFEKLPRGALHTLCPLLFDVADAGDEVARAVVERFIDEICVLVAVILRGLALTEAAPEVILGGGVLVGVDAWVIAEIESRCLKVAPRAVVRVVDVAPVVGAALYGLDTLGATEDAKARLRSATRLAQATGEQPR
jgi:N-acetylglucosamine kinase-like BadF-type ATPase